MSKLVDRAFLNQGQLNSAVKKLKLKRSKGLFIEATELTREEENSIFKSMSYQNVDVNKVYGFMMLNKLTVNPYYYVELRKEDANT